MSNGFHMSMWFGVIAVLLLTTTCLSLDDPKPLILIYSPGQPNYGNELARIIRQDPRVDAQTLILESGDLFETMIYFPQVKLIVVSLAEERPQRFVESINWFFNQGGCILGLGFAGSYGSTLAAANLTFPLFANDYKSGKYDPRNRVVSQTFIKDQPHAISEGLSGFTIAAQRLILSWNITTGAYWPRRPEQGDWTVLYRDSAYGAPAVVAYKGNGSSVTFATFGGEDFERGFGYYGHFTASEEFRTLFSNSVNWLWKVEHRYNDSMAEAIAFFEDRREFEQQVQENASYQMEKSGKSRMVQIILTLVLAVSSSLLIYWAVLVRSH